MLLTYLPLLLSAIVIAATAVIVRGQRALDARLERVEARTERLADAIALLTDTSEGAFQSVARQLERVSAPPAPRTRRPSTRKTTRKQPTSIADIAAAEGLSEGEVRLRLHLSAQPDEETHGALRS